MPLRGRREKNSVTDYIFALLFGFNYKNGHDNLNAFFCTCISVTVLT